MGLGDLGQEHLLDVPDDDSVTVVWAGMQQGRAASA